MDVPFELDGIVPGCGFPVDLDDPFAVTVFQNAAGVTMREVVTQPSATLTFITGDRRISIPFAGVLHTTYPDVAVVGAPARMGHDRHHRTIL